jgi:hypothetical protein
LTAAIDEGGGKIMRLIIILSLLMLSVSAWAGTFKDDFEDGNWDGWGVVTWDGWNSNVEDRVSIVDGVLRMDGMNKPEQALSLHIIEDWRDYSLSADMRTVETESGG